MAEWRARTPDPGAVKELARRGNLPEFLAGLLVNRGHSEPEAVERHLNASPMGLHEPALFPDMAAATERIQRAIEAKETILVHGDYDVDGVLGTTILMRLFDLVGARAVWHIPNRLEDGYSFGDHSIARAEATDAKLVISVDNGTSAGDVIAQLAERGIDTIVTDHHEPPAGPLPAATAIINPKVEGVSGTSGAYPWRELCGAAVAFKLAWGLAQALQRGGPATPSMKAFLEEATAYVAIATVCDVVPLRDENRVFARFGLKALANAKAHGLRALLEVAGIAGRPLTAEDVAFQIGPRINASGRLGSAHHAVECFLANDSAVARGLAEKLDALNKERREIEREVLVEARQQALDYPDAERDPVLVLAGQGWHQGVVGIVAARMTEEFLRPAIVIGLDGEEGRGSARTTGDFDVLAAIAGADEHLERWGGHRQAAGLEVRTEQVDAVRAAVNRRAQGMLAGSSPGEPELWFDTELPFDQMTEETMRHLDRLAPFGADNARPVFLSRSVHLARPARDVGAEGAHLMMTLREGHHTLKAMAFRQGHRLSELQLGRPIDLLFSPRWNTFRGQTNLEIELLDFRAS